MEPKKIARINELAKKKKEEGMSGETEKQVAEVVTTNKE